MRILLVEPAIYTPAGLDKREMRPTQLISLTLPYLAAMVPPEWEVDLVYEVCEDLERDYDLAAYDVVGITTQTIQLKRTLELARTIRGLGPRVVVGGPATVEDDHSLVPVISRFSDSVVVGEADVLWQRLLADLARGELKKIYQSHEPVPMSDHPLPRFDLVDFSKIEAPHVLPSFTARGCPRRCTFCSEFLYSKWRYRPVNDVYEELIAYRDRFHIPRVVFRDDDFLVFPKRSNQLLGRLAGEGIEWGCQTDFNLARHPDVVQSALDGGMRVVSFGVESVREKNREFTEKTFFTIPEAEDLLLRLHEAGVETQVNVIFGFDWDDPDVFDETYEFAMRTKVSRLFLSVLYPIPGTPLYEHLGREGRLLEKRPQGIDDPLAVTFTPKLMTADQLVEGYLDVERRFAEADLTNRNYWLGKDLVVI
ncbi:B12-binding domain-containing radical SAM protein [Streptomyces spongiae]|uniref:B12-binding domain-containing radical SAM protein n=1 Tax=Streptomyces spongiae TaxID=565072 RepID=A0A5N8XHT0_9ACTN|nr:radical SAM protein [Streptomyces spongiae]MPY58636.1 B12-binding domain-containing radical SAM protein [Streptomyces spongiae]